MAGPISSCLIYLDHNVLNSILKGDPDHIRGHFDGENVVAVFSNENLKEISHSRGFEEEFLDLLRDLGAKHLISLVDHAFVPTGKAQLLSVDPQEAYSSLMETLEQAPEGDFGLSELLRKTYGGLPDTSHREIISKGNQQLMAMLSSACKQLQDDSTIDILAKEKILQLMSQLPAQLTVASEGVAAALDSARQQLSVDDFENGTGLGPLELNNIGGPGVVVQIWEKLRTSMPGSCIELDSFFGLKNRMWSNDPNGVPTTTEKVNAIYHMLNFLGYFRDTNMKDERGLRRSFLDMTHAGMASYCHAFLSGDKRMVMKTRAAYEYLNVGTETVLLARPKE